MGAIALVLTGLLFTQFIRSTAAESAAETQDFARKANLALRRTAHQLLLKSGDDSSRVPPVKQPNAHTFTVRLSHSFSYSQLPGLLQESLNRYGIRRNYDVAVLDCARGELLLGYNFRDLTDGDSVPCGGRKQVAGCYNLQLVFASTQPDARSSMAGWGLAAMLLASLGYVVWKKSKRLNQPDTPVMADESRAIVFGESAFDSTTQTLISGANRYQLTYREAKLLQFFISHPNQILERDFILKSVWEDEGIVVGRSVDVFISRLRKLLQHDPTVRIIAVHGVGYRMELRG
ncbi:winged helix-turn-helix domain-containing protein [Spirosoma koreense]